MIKAKIAPVIKNGANGIKCCFLRAPHIPPSMHDTTNAIARPFVPNHKPPVASNFMSPMPIGIWEFGFFLCPIQSKMKPMAALKIYPSVAPMTAF